MPSRRVGSLLLVGIGHAAVDRHHHLRRRAPGDLRLDRRARRASTTRVELRAVVAAQRAPVRDRAVPHARRSARTAARAGSRSSCRRRRPCRRARRPRSPCCTPSCGLPSTARGSRAPANSIAWPVPPAVPILPMTASARSLAVTPGGRRPSTSHQHRLRLLRAAGTAWRARARPRRCRCRTPAQRMRRACWCANRRRRPSCPGSVAPCSGPITCTMPWRRSRNGK